MTFPWETKSHSGPWPGREAIFNEPRSGELPAALKRDANNKAPFMSPKLCEDEGCPQHGTPHVCINRVASPPASAPPSWVPPWGSKS